MESKTGDRTIEEQVERASRLIRAATGYEYGDDLVRDMGRGYAEYGPDDETPWVTGNWNPRRWPRGDDAPLTANENLGPRLGTALEKYAPDVQLEWSDEWEQCGNCWKLMRVEPNSYSWRMYGFFDDGACSYLCGNCALENFEDWTLPRFLGNESNAITFLRSSATMVEYGFEQIDGRFENGWHPGQDDTPQDALNRYRDELDDKEWVFVIPSVGQFDMQFELWARDENRDESEE